MDLVTCTRFFSAHNSDDQQMPLGLQMRQVDSSILSLYILPTL